MKKITLLLLIILSSCNKNEKYINTAIDIMEQNSIRKDSVDWNKMRAESLSQIKEDNSRENAYQIIKENLIKINDNHSFFMTTKSQKIIYDDDNELPQLNYEVIDKQIAYLKIPSFMENNKQTIEFAKHIQEIIKALDSQSIEKWIIDLRDNTGGNMWPMYLGLAPIIKEGISGYFINSKGEFSAWNYKNNAVFQGKTKLLEIKDSYEIKENKPKIAVLINSRTASSGEAIAVIFKKFPKTKFFGEDSSGLTTGNQMFDMSDGAKIVLTTTIFADRTKRIYGKHIQPDFYSLEPKEKAIEWLEKK